MTTDPSNNNDKPQNKIGGKPPVDEVQKTVRRVVQLLVIGFVLVVAIALVKMMVMDWAHEQDRASGALKEQAASQVEGVQGMKLGGAFELTRHDGETVSYASLMGYPHIIFFGFTYCPDVCPTELGAIANAIDAIGPEATKDLRVLYITVDPERDTPEQMANYVVMFHEKIEGLTGTPAQIEKVKKLYKVYSQKVESDELSDYTVDHSAFVYMFDNQGNLHSMYRSGTPMPELKQGIVSLLEASSSQ